MIYVILSLGEIKMDKKELLTNFLEEQEKINILGRSLWHIK